MMVDYLYETVFTSPNLCPNEARLAGTVRLPVTVPSSCDQVAEEISGVNQRIPYQIISLIKEFLINYINLTAADFSSLLYSALITTYLRLFLYGKLLFIFLPFL